MPCSGCGRGAPWRDEGGEAAQQLGATGAAPCNGHRRGSLQRMRRPGQHNSDGARVIADGIPVDPARSLNPARSQARYSGLGFGQQATQSLDERWEVLACCLPERLDEAETAGVEHGRPGGSAARRLGVRKRGGMDDGLGFDGGRLRDRIAVAGTETGAGCRSMTWGSPS